MTFTFTLITIVCGGTRGGAQGVLPPHALFLDQTKGRKKKIGETWPLPYLRVWMTAPAPPILYSKLYKDN